jgi:hypothetical protein
MQSQAMTINCRGQLIDLKQPSVMGILNVTPDSFFDGGKYATEKAILSQVERMLLEGATFIDIGAYSSKPNAEISQNRNSQTIAGTTIGSSAFPRSDNFSRFFSCRSGQGSH